jgi:hypothetical protein
MSMLKPLEIALTPPPVLIGGPDAELIETVASGDDTEANLDVIEERMERFFGSHDSSESTGQGTQSSGTGSSQDTSSVGTDTTLPSDYIYGFESLFASRSGPVTSSELMIWLKQFSGGINEQLRERMLQADMRNKLVQDLTYLKSTLTETANFDAFEAEAYELLKAYKGTPFESDVAEALNGVLINTDGFYDKDEISGTTGKMQSVIDKLGQDSQFDMIYIQQLTDKLNEQFGFASNYMSKQHDTLMAIIGNV